MFARKIQSVVWMDKKALSEGRDARRNFESLYIFDDGYGTKEDVLNAVRDMGLNEQDFVYIFFCGMWYAVHLRDYRSFAVISGEGVYYSFTFMEATHRVSAKAFVSSGAGRFVSGLSPDKKLWQDGIVHDMRMVDSGIRAEDSLGGEVIPSSALWNNTVITLGRMFFASEIRITTDDYVAHVMSNYYSDRSLDYEYDRIADLRKRRYLYYNPFTGEKSRTESERRKRAAEKLKGMEVPPCIKRERDADGAVQMREREIRPRKIYERTEQWYWANGRKPFR